VRSFAPTLTECPSLQGRTGSIGPFWNGAVVLTDAPAACNTRAVRKSCSHFLWYDKHGRQGLLERAARLFLCDDVRALARCLTGSS
jgi:hypothetical protein